MELVLTRKTFTEQSTIGELTVDGKFECFTLEDKVRQEKIAKITAIPYGRFRVKITWSPRFKVLMPLLHDVPGYDGIRIHTGNVAEHTEGCILVGTHVTKNAIAGGTSRPAYLALYAKIDEAEKRNETVWLTIKTIDPPEDTLVFNGRELRWMLGTQVKHSWPAVSGRVGYQGGQHQRLENTGPLPEGLWEVRQSGYQTMEGMSLLENLAQSSPWGNWRGGSKAWGKQRVWIEPAPGTMTHGRSGFSIHGGDDPGSAGCIDLTLSMTSFVHEFRKHGKDMKLTVQYTTDPGG